jgi:hypothetical protein
MLLWPKIRLTNKTYIPARKNNEAKPHRRIFLPPENSSSERL